MTYKLRIPDGLWFRSSVTLCVFTTVTILNCWAQNTETKPRSVTLKEGQVLEMKLAKRLDSRKANVGDQVMLQLNKPLLAEGVTVLPAGWMVHGRITEVKQAGKNCAYGAIHWTFEAVTTPEGGTIAIQYVGEHVARARLEQLARDATAARAGAEAGEKKSQKRGSSVGNVVKDLAIVPLAIVILPLAMLSEGGPESCPGGRGREVSIPAGRNFYAETVNDVPQIAAEAIPGTERSSRKNRPAGSIPFR